MPVQPVFYQQMPMPFIPPAQMPVIPPQPMPELQHAAMPQTKQEGNAMPMNGEMTVGDVFNSMTEDQKNVVYYILGSLVEGDENVKHSVFDNDNSSNSLAHADSDEGAADLAEKVAEGRDASGGGLSQTD